MDIARLIAAAKKIDEAAAQRERRAEAMCKLAYDARSQALSPGAIAERKRVIEEMEVWDLGGLVAELRAALRARRRKTLRGQRVDDSAQAR